MKYLSLFSLLFLAFSCSLLDKDVDEKELKSLIEERIRFLSPGSIDTKELLSPMRIGHAMELSTWGAGPGFRYLTGLKITNKEPYNDQDKSMIVTVDIEVLNHQTGPFVYQNGKLSYECLPPPALKDFGKDPKITIRNGLQVIVLFGKRGHKEIDLKGYEDNWM